MEGTPETAPETAPEEAAPLKRAGGLHHHGVHGGCSGLRIDPRKDRTRLAVTLALVLGYMVVEVVGGLLTNSLALLADAAHMLSDAGALCLSLFAAWIAQRPPTPQRSYGYYRAEILAALANGSSLLAIASYIIIEALNRLGGIEEVRGGAMLGVALGGLAVNVAGLLILGAGASVNLNVRAARLHILTDLLGSVGAMAAGVLIWAFGWSWADPVASVLIALLVMRSAWGLLKEAVGVLMESTPKHVDFEEVHRAMAGVKGVRGVHDLHVWTITTGMEMLSAHAVVEAGAAPQAVLEQLRKLLVEKFGIDHVAIQFEAEECGGCRVGK